MGQEFCNRLQAALLRFTLRHQDQRRTAIGDGGTVGRRHRSVFCKGGLQRRNFIRLAFQRLLVLVDDNITLAGLDGDRRDFGRKAAILSCLLGTAQGFNGISILRFTGELI